MFSGGAIVEGISVIIYLKQQGLGRVCAGWNGRFNQCLESVFGLFRDYLCEFLKIILS